MCGAPAHDWAPRIETLPTSHSDDCQLGSERLAVAFDAGTQSDSRQDFASRNTR
jgi:hypothetical protein